MASAQSLGYFYTGMTGANIHVSASTIPNWSITPAREVGEFIGGRFWMSAGPQTTLPITFLFFAGTYQDYLGNNFTALLSVTRIAAEVGSGGHSQVDFFANQGVTLEVGTTYTGLLLTQAVGNPSLVYQINDSFEWVPGEPLQNQSAAVPGPPAALVALAGLSWCVGSRRRSGGLA